MKASRLYTPVKMFQFVVEKNTDAIETVEKNPIRETEGTCQIEYNENSLGEI